MQREKIAIEKKGTFKTISKAVRYMIERTERVKRGNREEEIFEKK